MRYLQLPRRRGKQIRQFSQRPIPFEEGIMRAEHQNKVIANVKKMAAMEIDVHWTGTIIAYAKADEPLPPRIERQFSRKSWAINVPHRLRGKRNVAFLIDYPDYKLIKHNGKHLVVGVNDEKLISVIENFPKKSGEYENTIFGDVKLERADMHVGPILIGELEDENSARGKRIINLNADPSVKAYMHVELPESIKIGEHEGKLIIEGNKEELEEIRKIIEKYRG